MGTQRPGVRKETIASAAFANQSAVYYVLAVDLDPSLPTYTPESGLSCNLRSIGPDIVIDAMDSLFSKMLRGGKNNA